MQNKTSEFEYRLTPIETENRKNINEALSKQRTEIEKQSGKFNFSDMKKRYLITIVLLWVTSAAKAKNIGGNNLMVGADYLEICYAKFEEYRCTH